MHISGVPWHACYVRQSSSTKMAQGGELLSNYGFKSNEELLAGYGFALGPRNPADFFHIALRLGPARSGVRLTAA